MFLKPSRQSQTIWSDIQGCKEHDSNPLLQPYHPHPSLPLLARVLASNIFYLVSKYIKFFHASYYFSYKTLPIARIYAFPPSIQSRPIPEVPSSEALFNDPLLPLCFLTTLSSVFSLQVPELTMMLYFNSIVTCLSPFTRVRGQRIGCVHPYLFVYF